MSLSGRLIEATQLQLMNIERVLILACELRDPYLQITFTTPPSFIDRQLAVLKSALRQSKREFDFNSIMASLTHAVFLHDVQYFSYFSV